MSYQDFIKKMQSSLHDLHTILEEKNQMVSQWNQQFAIELSENKDYAFAVLASLENDFLTHEDQKKKQLSDIQLLIDTIHLEFQKTVEEYQKSHQVEKDKTRLLKLKEDNLAEFRQQKKKEIQDLTQKMNAFDKECIQLIKDNNLHLEEEDKVTKTKLAELDKRLKFEVNRVNETLLTPFANDADKQEAIKQGNYNKEEEITLRNNGIDEIAKIKQKYMNEMKEIELAFHFYQSNVIRNNEILREEYNLKIEQIKFNRQNANISLQEASDRYDFDTYQQLNQFELDYNLEANKIRLFYQGKLKEENQKRIQLVIEEQEGKGKDFSMLFDQVQLFDQKQIELLEKQLDKNHVQFFQSVQDTTKYMESIAQSVKELVTAIVLSAWKSIENNMQSLQNNMVFNLYSLSKLEGFDYSVYANELVKIIQEFTVSEQNQLQKFDKLIMDHFKDYIRQMKNTLTDITEFFAEQKNQQNHLINQMKKMNNRLYRQANQDASDKFTHFYNGIETQKKNQEEQTTKEHQNLLQDNKKANELFVEKTLALKQKKEHYQLRKRNDDYRNAMSYQSLIDSIKENINQIKKRYKENLKLGQSTIQQKYKNILKDIELERKTKRKIGQI